MGNFWMLVGFEYKKILVKKSFIIAICLMLFVSTYCMIVDVIMGSTMENGEFLSRYEVSQNDLKHIHKVAGPLDDAMISDVIVKNVQARDTADKNGIYPKDIYQKNIAPYSGVRSKLARVLSPIEAFNFENFNRLDSLGDINFYALRDESIKGLTKSRGNSEAEAKAVLELNAKLDTPFYYDFYDAYQKFLGMMSTTGVLVIVSVAICIAPIFSGEYKQKTDAIILPSKNGRSKLITAKLFTAISFGAIFTLVAVIIAVASVFLVYSPTGANVSFQMYSFYSVYNITMLQALFIYCGVLLMVSIMVSAFITFLSSKLTPYATVIISTLMLFGTMFFSVPSSKLRMLNYFLPSKMLHEANVFNDTLINVFGMYLKPYYFIPIVCVVGVMIFAPLAYRGFKNHQVG